jgi:hypothetical protein
VAELKPNATRKPDRKKPLVILSLFLLAIAGLVLWLTDGFPREPLHKGKPTSYWVDGACRGPNESFVQEVEEIGSPAVPHLVAKLRLKDTWLRRTWGTMRRMLPLALRSKLPPVESVDWVHHSAVECLFRLGPKAESAVPELIVLIREQPQDWSYVCAVLEEIGPKARQGLPALRNQMTSKSLFDQVSLAKTIWAAGGDTNLACEIFAKALTQDQDDTAAMNVAAFAKIMGPQAVSLESALEQLATNTARSAGTRNNATCAVGALGLSNETVVAILLEGIKSPELNVRTDCAMDLWHINPKYASLAVPIVVEMLVDKKKRLPGDRTELLDYKFKKLDFVAAIPALRKITQTGPPEARQIADEALRKLDTKTADDAGKQ